jgi:hypothetical protein
MGESDEIDVDLNEDDKDVELTSAPSSNGVAHPEPPEEIVDASPISNRNYISNEQFDAARGRPVTLHPAAASKQHHSNASVFSIAAISTQYQLEILNPQDLTNQEIGDVNTLLLKREWIEDEERLRRAISLILNSIDGVRFPETNSTKGLRRLKREFLTELRASETLREIAMKLADDPKEEPPTDGPPQQKPRRRTNRPPR